MTNILRDEFKKLNCMTSYIPGGYTGFVQVLDQASDHADKYHDRYKARDFIVADRRILLTNSEDAELKIKGLPDIVLSTRAVKAKEKKEAEQAKNYTKIAAGRAFPLYEDDGAKGYDPDNLINVGTSLRDLVEESSEDKGEYEETKVSRYFTRAEVEAEPKEARALKEEMWPKIDPSDKEEPLFDTTDDEFDETLGGRRCGRRESLTSLPILYTIFN
ncbi:hypothetical protein B0J14DRAFT_571029 [Halenospora varia]|nr:hypothetical protein B0J14DRAFT_571029 [Halenospora varia]